MYKADLGDGYSLIPRVAVIGGIYYPSLNIVPVEYHSEKCLLYPQSVEVAVREDGKPLVYMTVYEAAETMVKAHEYAMQRYNREKQQTAYADCLRSSVGYHHVGYPCGIPHRQFPLLPAVPPAADAPTITPPERTPMYKLDLSEGYFAVPPETIRDGRYAPELNTGPDIEYPNSLCIVCPDGHVLWREQQPWVFSSPEDAQRHMRMARTQARRVSVLASEAGRTYEERLLGCVGPRTRMDAYIQSLPPAAATPKPATAPATPKPPALPLAVELQVEATYSVNSVALRLSFCPMAIRDHYEMNPRVAGLSHDQLLAIGERAVTNDTLYKTMCIILDEAVEEICGFNPGRAGHAGEMCAHCQQEITSALDGTSTPQGSMHQQCAREHETAHPGDW